MVGTVFSLVDPVAARLLLLWLDGNEPRGRKAWLVLLPIYLAVHIGWFTLARTDAWLEYCRWFLALPLT